jgi:hypothetical protein
MPARMARSHSFCLSSRPLGSGGHSDAPLRDWPQIGALSGSAEDHPDRQATAAVADLGVEHTPEAGALVQAQGGVGVAQCLVEGTPQGAVFSPLVANVCLHYGPLAFNLAHTITFLASTSRTRDG